MTSYIQILGRFLENLANWKYREKYLKFCSSLVSYKVSKSRKANINHSYFQIKKYPVHEQIEQKFLSSKKSYISVSRSERSSCEAFLKV